QMLARGEIARLNESLTIYRVHATNTSTQAPTRLFRSAVKILTATYCDWLGENAESAATLMIRHFSYRAPPADATTLQRVGDYLERLLGCFLASHPQTPADGALIREQAGSSWWGVVRAGMHSGQPWLLPHFFRSDVLSQ